MADKMRSVMNHISLVLFVAAVAMPSLPLASVSAQTPDPTQLPVATTSQVPLTSAYNALNVPAKAAGEWYLDPTTNVKIYKLTSATYPIQDPTNPNWGHDYSEGGDEVSLPYCGNTRAVLVRKSDQRFWLIDFTPGVGVGYARELTGVFRPWQQGTFTFSNNQATPYYAYVSNGSQIIRIDISGDGCGSNTVPKVAPGNGWPVNETNATWLHQSENDGFFVWQREAEGPVVVGYEPSTGTLKTHTEGTTTVCDPLPCHEESNINEPRIDRAGRYVGLAMNHPGDGICAGGGGGGICVWDWLNDEEVASADGTIPFAHVGSLRRRWVGVHWGMTWPGEFSRFLSIEGPPYSLDRRAIGGPANGTLTYGNGNWIQNPANLDDQWALFSHYGSLEPPCCPGWLAPGGMILITSPDAGGQRRLLGHPYNTKPVAQYDYLAFPKLSSDGWYVLLTSDMNGSVRSDVFLAEMPPSSGGDTTPPTVAITAPANGATVSGTITVSADASDNVSVVGVQFKLDGANLGAEDTTAPYSISWNTTTATNGAHTLTAVARDAASNSTTSAVVNVTVSNGGGDTTPPTVSITAPANGATVSGTITVSANATDNVGVVGVQFKLDGANLGAEDTTAPYSISWNTTTATNGAHTLTAVARDAASNSTTSAVVNVTVSNAQTQNVVWTNLVNVTANGNSITKTSGCNGCEDAGATSQQQITSGNGYVEFTATEMITNRSAGLGTGNTNTTRSDIEYAITLWIGGNAEVYENDVWKASLGGYVTGDRFRVAVEGSVVKYYKNGTLFYPLTPAEEAAQMDPTYPLRLDTSLWSSSATINNAVISGNLSP